MIGTKTDAASQSPPKSAALDKLAASVHWLQTGFLSEVLAAGLDRNSKIYKIENLNGPPGVIRTKGRDVISPIDGKAGAAYVHCLEGEDNVGNADYMLSYGWGYTIGEIVETLNEFCAANDLNRKRTYVWVCCLCVNQHRVVEQEERKKSGMLVPAVDFFAEFRERVTGIGRVLAMMAPWSDPLYLKRVWCVFELWTANENDCEVSIVMPPAEMKAVERDILGEGGKIDALYEALERTKVQNAEASVKADLDAILEMVQRHPGYTILNNRVNELLRQWVRGVVDEVVKARRNQSENPTTDASFARLCNKVGALLHRNAEFDSSLEFIQEGLAIRQLSLGDKHKDTIESRNNVGAVLVAKGEYDMALEEYHKLLSIHESDFGTDYTEEAADLYHKIGKLLYLKRDYDGALSAHKTALAIREAMLGDDHPQTKECHTHISLALTGKGDLDGSMAESCKTLAIDESDLEASGKHSAQFNNWKEFDNEMSSLLQGLGGLGFDFPPLETSDGVLQEKLDSLSCKAIKTETVQLSQRQDPNSAESHNEHGTLLFHSGDYDGALVEYRKALALNESLLGALHPNTADSHDKIRMTLQQQGELDEAMTELQKCLNIYKSVFGVNHSNMASCYSNIGSILHGKGNEDEALVNYRKALQIRELVLGADHPDTASLHDEIGLALQSKGDYRGSLEEFQKALNIRESVFGKNHQDTATSYHNIGSLLCEKGDYKGGMEWYQKHSNSRLTHHI